MSTFLKTVESYRQGARTMPGRYYTTPEIQAEEREKDGTSLRELEDEAIRTAVQRQIDLGLDVVTDGEFRRWMFLNSFYDTVSGVRLSQAGRFSPRRGRLRPSWRPWPRLWLCRVGGAGAASDDVPRARVRRERWPHVLRSEL
mgnify:CR=1 FL=1